jgi:hypothetical protein
MMAVAFSVLLFTGVYGFYNASSQTYSAGVAGQNLQDGSDIILTKITEGESETGTVYRLSTAISYLIPNGTGTSLYTCGGATQILPCNSTYPNSELYYCQDSPCTPTDSTARWYYLNSAGTSVIYHHPSVSGGGTVEETVYKAPTGSTMVLRFESATGTPANVVEVDAALTQNLASNVTNARMATSGSGTTYVLLRDHP